MSAIQQPSMEATPRTPTQHRQTKKAKMKKAKKPKESSKVEPEPKVAKTAEEQPKPFREEELHCIVCFELPEGGQIYQCKNGHLLCKVCHERVVEGDKPQCPSCRVHLSRERPVRNRFAEDVLASLLVECAMDGCNRKLKHSALEEHETEQCEYREVVCKYEPLGCAWKGPHRESKPHSKECEIRKLDFRALLKLARTRDAVKRQQEEQKNLRRQGESEVCKALSSRCRNITVRDIIMHKDHMGRDDQGNALMMSCPFGAIGMHMELLLVSRVKPGTEAVPEHRMGLVLRLVSNLKRRVYIQLLVLRGPELPLALRPCTFRVALNRKQKESSPCFLPLTPEEIIHLQGAPQLHLRIAFLDCSSGPPSHTFHADGPPLAHDTESDHNSTDEEESQYSDGDLSWSSNELEDAVW